MSDPGETFYEDDQPPGEVLAAYEQGVKGVTARPEAYLTTTEGTAVNAAADLDALGGILRCSECGTRKTLSTGDIAGYLEHGWPVCHGFTMTWVTQRELDEGEK